MLFKTANSTYEIDTDNQMVRRLYGKQRPTGRQGADGEWRKYVHVSPVEVGKNVVIVWGTDGKFPSLVGRMTTTSPVVEIGGSASN